MLVLDRKSRRHWSPAPGGPAVSLCLLLCVACTQRVVPAQRAMTVAPMLSVEAFLQASNSRDYEAMARLFGTPGGPLSDTGSTFSCAFRKMGSWIGLASSCQRWEDVELRMAAIATILEHVDYQIVGERREPGRSDPTNRVTVNLTQGERVVQDVPFMVVQTGSGSWLVQEIDLVKLTSS